MDCGLLEERSERRQAEERVAVERRADLGRFAALEANQEKAAGFGEKEGCFVRDRGFISESSAGRRQMPSTPNSDL